MTILVYVNEGPLPIGVGSTKSGAIAEALLTIAYLGSSHETLFFREMDLFLEEEQMLCKAIKLAREKAL